MKKNLLLKPAADAIVERIGKLTPTAKPSWGEMNAVEMLLHCNICNLQILKQERGGKRTSLGQFLLRILALYIAPHFKKGLKSEPANVTKSLIDNSRFEEQKAQFIQIVQQFPENRKPLTLTHPAFGNISTWEWGIAAYKHMDHHLRQFGV